MWLVLPAPASSGENRASSSLLFEVSRGCRLVLLHTFIHSFIHSLSICSVLDDRGTDLTKASFVTLRHSQQGAVKARKSHEKQGESHAEDECTPPPQAAGIFSSVK